MIKRYYACLDKIDTFIKYISFWTINLNWFSVSNLNFTAKWKNKKRNANIERILLPLNIVAS